MKNSIHDGILYLVNECAPLAEVQNITNQTNLMDELEYDSLSIMDLFEQINDEFGIDCYENPEIYDSLESVSDLIQFVTKLVSEKEERK